MNKIKVYHFHNGTGGGVLSIIKNLLEFSRNPQIENHVIYTINKLNNSNYNINNLKGATSERVFYYSPKWNFYYTCKQLSKLIPDANALLVTHDWLELGMISNLGLQNRVITFLHGDYDYYYQLAQLHESSVDLFIAIAKNIEQNLNYKLQSKNNNVTYLRFPVPVVNFSETINKNNIVFVGRKTVDKGFNLLPKIDALLKKNNILLNWHIVGDGDYIDKDLADWINSGRVKMYGKLSNESTLELIPKMNYYILPSIAEGMPVSLIEAMKAGLIPFVNDIEGGIQELIDQRETGYKVNLNDPQLYANYITEVHNNGSIIEKIRNNCTQIANKLFDPLQNSDLLEAAFLYAGQTEKRIKFASRIYGSRLDHHFIPNFITIAIRSI